jgi:hypothetical protein
MSQDAIGTRLDGNAAAGLLHDVFVFDATVARITCATCARRLSIGSLSLYDIEMGAPYCAVPIAMRSC